MSTNNKVQYFTIQGLEDLKRELKELKDKKIPDIANLIDEAKQQGDLSENAEYHQAKEDMAWAQGRLQEINYLLDNAEVVDSAQKNQNIVLVGSAITVKTNAFTKSYTIVGPQESS